MSTVIEVGNRRRLWVYFGTNVTWLAAQASAGDTTITLRDATGYANGDPIIVSPGQPHQELRTVSGTPTAAGVVTLSSALLNDHEYRGEDETHGMVMELTAPSDPTIKLRDPAGTITIIATGTLTNPGTGRYYYDKTFDTEGTWRWRGYATSGVVAAGEGVIVVKDSVFV
jgi:hypothetical protein